MKQYVYKLLINNQTFEPKGIDINSGNFFIFNDLYSARKILHLFIKRYGLSLELLKVIIKLLIKRNSVYIILMDNIIVSDGMVSFGRCNHYDIGVNDCVIGPVYTDSEYRGKGLASFGLMRCIKYINKNSSVDYIYIDTSERNSAMQKVIRKIGFGEPIESYERASN